MAADNPLGWPTTTLCSIVKTPGVTLDSVLFFGRHVANITSKATGRCYVLTDLKAVGLEERPNYLNL